MTWKKIETTIDLIIYFLPIFVCAENILFQIERIQRGSIFGPAIDHGSWETIKKITT